jgi:Zn-dependent protease
MQLPPADQIAAIAIVIFFGIGLHEYAHCKMADLAGDPTPGIQGRVTLNLTKHFTMMGTLMIIITSLSGIGIGWGKPSPCDPRKMRNPRWDFFASVAAGPISNVLQAAVYAILLRIAIATAPQVLQNQFIAKLLVFGVAINLSLFFFNLIPFGPLDGHWLIGSFMPDKQRFYWYRFNQQVGMMGLFALIIVSDVISKQGGPDIVWIILGKPMAYTFQFFTGIAFPI